MTKLSATIAGLAVGFGLSASAWACNTSSGEIAKIDTKSNTVVLAKSCCGDNEVTFTLKQDTKVLINGKDAKLADLKAGDKVKVNYEKIDDVLSISVTRDS